MSSAAGACRAKQAVDRRQWTIVRGAARSARCGCASDQAGKWRQSHGSTRGAGGCWTHRCRA